MRKFSFTIGYVYKHLIDDYFREKNEISVWNNGRGIPVVEHQNEKMYVPELIFGTLLTSSNYDDNDARLTGKKFMSSLIIC